MTMRHGQEGEMSAISKVEEITRAAEAAGTMTWSAASELFGLLNPRARAEEIAARLVKAGVKVDVSKARRADRGIEAIAKGRDLVPVQDFIES